MPSVYIKLSGSLIPAQRPPAQLQEATVSPVEKKLMEVDRLKMCGMMWLKEHETCSPMDAAHGAAGETQRQLNAECCYVKKKKKVSCLIGRWQPQPSLLSWRNLPDNVG